jgi:hypothetical protein
MFLMNFYCKLVQNGINLQKFLKLILMAKILFFITLIVIYNSLTVAMEKKPYHHLPDGTYRNPEGSPVR